jgi:PTH1 family peptidyl-tRNA hydrolase
VRLLRRRRQDDGAASWLDLLVVGLGNPGRRYEGNRHNVGRMVVEELARRHGASFRSKFSGRFADIRLDGQRIALLVPDVYMNESGHTVGGAVRFFKLPIESLLVVHDEGDFELGRLQARVGGGLAGHNGLRSIARQLGSQDFQRLRVGVGRPGRGDGRDLADYVLADFEPADDAEAIVQRAADAVETLVRDGLEATQRQFH